MTGLPVRLACCDCTFPRLSHRGAVEVIRDLGFAAVDICVLAGYENNPPRSVIDDPASAADSVRAAIERTGLEVSDAFAILSDPFEALAVNHPDRGIRAESLRQFQQIARFAARIGAPGMTVLPGMPFPGIEDDRGLELAADELQRRAEIAAEAGMALSIEPHVGSIVGTPERTLELLERASDVMVTLDYSHFVYQGIPQADADELISRTRHIHLRAAAPGVMQARAREGTIDFTVMVERLAEAGYAGYLSHEYIWEEWLGCNGVDCISETAELRDLVVDALDRVGR